MNHHQNSHLTQFQQILNDHIEQMSKNLDNVSNGHDRFTFKVYDRVVLIAICEQSRQIFRNDPIILNIKGECIVVGDIHGHIIDLYRIFRTFDLPPKTTYLFLGDIVDRGGFSLETITLILVLKILFPNHIYIIRGNHEFDYNLCADKMEGISNSLYSEILHSYDKIDSSRRKCYHQAIQQRLGSNTTSPNKQSTPETAEETNESRMGLIPKSSAPTLLQSPTSKSQKRQSAPHLQFSSNSKKQKPASDKSPASGDNQPQGNLQSMPNSSFEFQTGNLQSMKNSTFEFSKPPLNLGNISETCRHSHADRLFNEFSDTFSFMPLAAMFGDSIFCIHGGIGGTFADVNNDLRTIERPILDYENNTVENVLWSDPLSHTSCDYDHVKFLASPRGRGCVFSKKAFDMFMRKNNLKLMLRGHQCVDGIQIQYNSHLITIFSASNYCGLHSNKSGVVKILSDKSIRTHIFPPFRFMERSSAFFINNSNGRAFTRVFLCPKQSITTSYSVDLSSREFQLLPLSDLNNEKTQEMTKYVTTESFAEQGSSLTNSFSFDSFPLNQSSSEPSSPSRPTERRRIVIVKPKINTSSLS